MKDEESGALLTIETALVRPPAGCIRIISGDVWWDIERDDLVRVELLDRKGLSEAHARYGRVYLKRGARVRALGPADEYRDKLWHTVRPFASASRPQLEFEPPASFRALEEAFLTARGIRR